jgi:hypothetical protein
VKISRGKCIEAIKGMSETLDRALFHTWAVDSEG